MEKHFVTQVNTSEKIRLVRFDSAKLFESKQSLMQCLGYKNLKAKDLKHPYRML